MAPHLPAPDFAALFWSQVWRVGVPLRQQREGLSVNNWAEAIQCCLLVLHVEGAGQCLQQQKRSPLCADVERLLMLYRKHAPAMSRCAAAVALH